MESLKDVEAQSQLRHFRNGKISVDSGHESLYDRRGEIFDQPFQGGTVMKKSVLMMCVLGLVAPSVMALDAFPMTTVCELGTATT